MSLKNCLPIVVGLLLTYSGGNARAADGNLLENGGFEKGTEGWNINPAFQAATVVIVTGKAGKEVHGGKQAVRVTNAGEWSNLAGAGGLAGRVYELTFWARGGEPVKAPDGKTVSPAVGVNIYEYGNVDPAAGSQFLVTINTMRAEAVGPEWKQFTSRFTPVAEGGGAGVRTFGLAMGTQGDVYLDDIVLNEVETWREGLTFYLPFDKPVFVVPVEGMDAAQAGGSPKGKVNGELSYVEGRKGQAAVFVKNANLVFDADGNFNQAEGALAMWVQPYWPEGDGQPHTFFEVPLPPDNFLDGCFVFTKGFSSGIVPDALYFYSSPGHYAYSGSGIFQPSEWIHLAFTWSYSKGFLKFYRNGQLVGVSNNPQMQTPPPSAGRPLVIGARLGGKFNAKSKDPNYWGQQIRDLPDGGGWGADSAIDELMIFNRPLNDAEVALLADAKVAAPAAKVVLDSAHINRVETTLETPHLNFGKPSAQGPVRTLFITPVEPPAPRDIVELAQRCDVDFTAVTAPAGFRDGYYRNWEGLAPEEKEKELLAKLAENPEVIVRANIDYGPSHRRFLSGQVEGKIMELVNNGAGLVITFPKNLPEFKQPLPAGQSAIATGIPWTGMPECFPGAGLSVEDLAKRVIQTYEYGKGRVVVLATEPRIISATGYASSTPGLVPFVGGTRMARWTRQYEHRYNYYQSLVGKAVQWAGKREPRARWNRLPAEGATHSLAEWQNEKLPVEVLLTGEPLPAAVLTYAYRDPWGQVEAEGKQELSLTVGANTFNLPSAPLKSGLHYLDLVLSAAGKVENWATISFRLSAPEEIAELTTKQEHYERGETVQGEARFAGALTAAAVLEIRAVDTEGRVYNQTTTTVAAGATSAAFQIAVDRPTTLASYIEADVVRDSQVLSRADTTVFVPKRDPRQYGGFLSVIWCGFNEGIGLVGLRQLRKAGFNAVYHWATGNNDFHNDAMADMMPTQYCTRITVQADERGWGPTFDEKDGSVANPKVQAAMRAVADGTSESRPLGPPYYSLGDENWFRFGIGYSPYGLEYFRGFLQRRYGTIENLNTEYGAKYKDFSEVPRYHEGEALQAGLLPALIDHLLATEDEWAAYHQFMADEIRKRDPGAKVGAEGSESGNLERMLQGVQLWAPYGDDVLLRSLASPDILTSHWWGGYGAGGTDGSYGGGDDGENPYAPKYKPSATTLWRWLFRGFANFEQFFAADAVGDGMLNPGFTYRSSIASIMPEMLEIKGGAAQLLTGSELISDKAVAIHYSIVSDHAGMGLKQLGTAQGSRAALVQTMNKLRQEFRYFSSRQITDGKLKDSPPQLLYLPASAALSAPEAENIAAFVNAGGTVVADLPPGGLNEFGRRLPAGRLDALFGMTCGGKTEPAAITDLNLAAELKGEKFQLSCPRTTAEGAVTVQGAQPLAHAGAIPLLLLNEVGKGRAILLNFDLSRCSEPMKQAAVKTLLRVAGVESPYLLEGPAGTELSVRQRGAVTLVGLILPPESPDAAKLSWAEPAYAYDVRAGKSLGRVSEIALPSAKESGQRVHLFALQSAPVSAVSLSGPRRLLQGKSMPIEVKVKTGKIDPAGRLVRIEVLDPAGEPVTHYRDFITLGKDATVSASIPFAFNDTPGKWTVRATDIASGIHDEITVSLRPGPVQRP